MYFDLNSKFVEMDLSSELLKNYGTEKPIVICLGNSKVLSDMVGVFVADILKSRNVDAIVFGGSKRNFDKPTAKYISKYVDESRILFVDSGALNKKDAIMFASQIVLNDGTVLNSPCVVANTISKNKTSYNFANKTFQEIKNYAITIANGICSYFSYVDLLKSYG